MIKNINLCIDLKTVMQTDPIMPKGKCYNGVICRESEDRYRFEESVRHNRTPQRNPKLYDGRYCSLVHMKNGKYQVHMKPINASDVTDTRQLAFDVYSELLNAFRIIEL